MREVLRVNYLTSEIVKVLFDDFRLDMFALKKGSDAIDQELVKFLSSLVRREERSSSVSRCL